MAKGGSDFDTLPQRSKNAARGVNEVANAFEELSKKGKVSHGTVMGLASSLAAFGPAGVVIGSVAAASYTLFAAWEKHKNLEYDRYLREIANAAAITEKATISYYDALADGMDRTTALAVKERARIRAAFDEGSEFRRKEIKALEESNLALEKLFKHAQRIGQTGSLENLAVQYGKNQDRAAALAGEIEGLAVTAGQSASAFDRETRALRALNAEIERNERARQNALERVQAEVNARNRMMDESEFPKGEAVTDDVTAAMERATASTDTFHEALGRVSQDWQSDLFPMLSGTMVTAFELYTDAVEEAIDSTGRFQGITASALRNVGALVLRQMGITAAAHVGEELAYAVTTSLNPAAAVMYGPPAVHLQAAAIWGLQAAAYGGASAIASTGGGNVSAGGGGGGGLLGGGGPNGGGGGNHYSFTIIGNMDTETREEIIRQLNEASTGRDL